MDRLKIRRHKVFVVMAIAFATLLFILTISRFTLIKYLFNLPIKQVYSYNLVPFRGIVNGWVSITELSGDMIGNLLMFIPLGVIYCYFQKKKSILKSSFFCMLTSIGIEAFQRIFKTGAVDVNDLILNTMGGIIGACAFALIDIFARKSDYSTKEIVEITATIFPPFLLFQMIYSNFSGASYTFALVHLLPIALYFVAVELWLLRDITQRAKVIYYSGCALFALVFFTLVL